jgi:hypothetical protein
MDLGDGGVDVAVGEVGQADVSVGVVAAAARMP